MNCKTGGDRCPKRILGLTLRLNFRIVAKTKFESAKNYNRLQCDCLSQVAVDIHSRLNELI